MTSPSDLVARLKDDADYLQTWIDDGLETDFTMDPDGMRNQQKHFRDCAAAIEQLQAELLEYKQCLDAGIEHRMRRKAETEAESLRAELEAVKAQIEIIRDKLVSTELLEALAAVEHNRWAGWMRYQETASAERRADWPRKAGLAYTQLTHNEQESDREEVRTTLAVIEDSLNAAVRAAHAQAGGK